MRKLADIYGRPIIAYVKDDGFIAAARPRQIRNDGAVCADQICDRSSPIQRSIPSSTNCSNTSIGASVISGIGERPAIAHLTHYKLAAFTSGSVCVAPALSTALLRALQRGDLEEAERLRALFIPLEDLRDKSFPLARSPCRRALAGIAETGPLCRSFRLSTMKRYWLQSAMRPATFSSSTGNR